MNISKRHLVSLFIGLTVLATASCSETEQATTEQASAPTGEVNLYSSRHYDTDEQLYQEFTDETGIEVNVIEGDADELIERIKSEGANTPADVFMTVDIGRLWRAQQAGILQPVSSSVLESEVSPNLRSAENDWFGFSQRARVIIYNKDKVEPSELSTYEALAQPQWQDRVCVRSSSNIYNQSLVAAKIEEKGVEQTQKWVKGMVDNFAREPEGNDTDQIKAVASGECDVALVNHYYVARLEQENDPEAQQIIDNVGVFFPDQNEGGTHVNISGGGVVENAPHPDNAVKFLEFLVTPEAQEILANANYEYPVVTDVQPNPAIANFGEFKPSDQNIAAYGEKNAEAVELMDRAGWK